MSLAINGTDGIDFNADAAKIKVGAGDDLQIYHDGTDNYLDQVTGYLRIRDVANSREIAKFHSSNSQEFYMNGTKRLEVTNTGISVTGSATLSSGAYIGGSGGGNLLNDYEEGTFTPSISFNSGTTGIAYTTQSGHYTKIGNLVTCIFEIQLSNKGSSTGYMRIHGLPFTVERRGSFNLGYYDTFDSSVTEPLIGLATSSTDIIPYQTGDSNSSDLTEGHFNNATRFFGTITYMTSQ